MSGEFFVNKNGGFLEDLVTEIERRKTAEEREEKLDELLSKCTSENAHEEINFGTISGDALRRVLPKLKNDIIKVGFKRLSDDAVIPTKAHPTDSGFDLVASTDVLVEPGETAVVPTGIAVQLPPGYEAQVRPRSGVTAKTKLRVQLGTIDNGYAGEIGVIVDNVHPLKQAIKHIQTLDGDIATTDVLNGGISVSIRKGDRLAQLVIQPIPAVEAIEVFDVEETDRGDRGYGSTGVNSGDKTWIEAFDDMVYGDKEGD